MSASSVVNVILAGMDERKSAIFRMAFKMHAGVTYTIIDPSSGEKPDVGIVDVDNVDGMKIWNDFKAQYPDIPAMLTSMNEPEFSVPYLSKPITIEALFPTIRAVMQGGGIFNPDEKKLERQRLEQEKKEKLKGKKIDNEGEFVVHRFQRKEQLPTASIEVFDPETGLLGGLRQACRQDRDVALIYQNKPLLIAFPSDQKILLAVAPDVLKKLCRQDGLAVNLKPINDNPEWREKAKVSFESCLWQFAVWSSCGRLVSEIGPDVMMRMKGWPNLTRLAHIQDSMRLSAFMTQTTANLHILYKILRVELIDLLNYISATYMIGLLVTDAEQIKELSQAPDGKEYGTITTQGNGLQENEFVVRQKYKSQSTGMLQRLMSKLTNTDEK